MVVLSLPECDLGNFQLVRATSFRQTQWYEADISKVLNPQGLEQRSVKIYQQEDLGRFIEDECTNKEFQYRQLNYYLDRLKKK